VLPQAQAMDWRGVLFRKERCRLAYERDLFHVGAAIGASRKMQTDPDLRHDRQSIIKVLGRSIRDIAAGQPAVDPLRGMVFHLGSLRLNAVLSVEL
jgi:hypothetical protein